MARARLTRGIAALCVAIGLAASISSLADEIAIYESLSDVTIGRVFLSSSQRAYLDTGPVMPVLQVRKLPPTEPVESKKDPAGYIINSSGVSSVWSQQGFVTREGASRITFPGDVKITRKETTESSDLSSTETREPASVDEAEDTDNGA